MSDKENYKPIDLTSPGGLVGSGGYLDRAISSDAKNNDGMVIKTSSAIAKMFGGLAGGAVEALRKNAKPIDTGE
jgi:hypothetical protein